MSLVGVLHHTGMGGRTHSMVVVGDSMLLFGGGAGVSPSLGFLKFLPGSSGPLNVEWCASQDSSLGQTSACVCCPLSGPRIQIGTESTAVAPTSALQLISLAEPRRVDKTPLVTSGTCSRRISHAAVLAGRYMVVYGGWSGQVLRDVQLLDLAANLPLKDCPVRALLSNTVVSASNCIVHKTWCPLLVLDH